MQRHERSRRRASSSSRASSEPPPKALRKAPSVYRQKNYFDMLPNEMFNKVVNYLPLCDYLSLYQAYQRASGARQTLVDASDQFNINDCCNLSDLNEDY
ncbi:ORF156 [Lymantria xylina nucleopolyhedrovirus]|uniref:11.4 kDa protein n=2 Tax=Lymantria xylina nucleopolyhedrovirus TaxID=166921 RepID=Q5MAS8_9ABAC|nr:ORF156 [Lymantria xylina nucleopolyhedrovirus]AAW28855.1 11.4 kDa protein [Lymantria xylina nucleopolyhedrovirus]ADD73865.1 ORF156 [Lymantria xylina nucleopolyhedrovirus]